MLNKKTIIKISVGILPVLMGLMLSVNNVITIEKKDRIVSPGIIDDTVYVENKNEIESVSAEEVEEKEEEDVTKKNMVVISESGLNVRQTPDTSAPIIDTLPFVKSVEILGSDIDNKWYRIENGFISSKYIMEYDEAIKEGIITDKDVEHFNRVYEDYEMDLNMDVTGISGLNINDIREYTSRHKGLQGVEKALIDAEYEYGINAFFILSVAALESAHGNSDIAVFKNNLFGMNAHDSDPYNLAFNYDSKHESIMDFARRIKEYYVDQGLTSLDSIQSKYCPTNDKWDETVNDVMKSIYKYASEGRE